MPIDIDVEMPDEADDKTDGILTERSNVPTNGYTNLSGQMLYKDESI
jgi:hypothetical protein